MTTMNPVTPSLPTRPLCPVKTREMHNHHFDSTVWNDLRFRDDDVVIATYAKSGTTWTQQIVAQLIFDGAEGLNVPEMSPWLDLRVPPREVKLPAVEAQTHRRFLKTHLPVDALVFSEKAKYIYIGRDGRDVVWSLHNHHSQGNDAFFAAINDTPGRVGPALDRADPDIARYFRTWLDHDGSPFWPFWENVRTWWAIRHLPNVMMLHFADLKRDMPGQIRRVAEFLEIPVRASSWDRILEHCSFEYMKRHPESTVPLGGVLWEGGAGTFLHKGVNGRWRDTLGARDVGDYEARALAELGRDCARWLSQGGEAR